jgi:hypothetical protein
MPSKTNSPIDSHALNGLAPEHAYTDEDVASVQKAPIDPALVERVIRHMIAQHPEVLLSRTFASLRASARVGCAKSASLLKLYTTSKTKSAPEKGGQRAANSMGVRWARLMRKNIEAIKNGRSVMEQPKLIALINKLPTEPTDDFPAWFKAAEALYCLMMLNRLPTAKTWEADIQEAIDLDEKLIPLGSSSASGEKKPWRRIRSRLREAAQTHWK